MTESENQEVPVVGDEVGADAGEKPATASAVAETPPPVQDEPSRIPTLDEVFG